MPFEQMNKLMTEKTNLYFEKYFENKSPDEYLCKISRDVLLTLGKTDAKFQVILNCLQKISNDTSYFNTLNSEIKEQISNTIVGIEEICRCLEEMIDSIIKEATA